MFASISANISIALENSQTSQKITNLKCPPMANNQGSDLYANASYMYWNKLFEIR